MTVNQAGAAHGPEQIGFLLVPQFSMIGFFSAVEPLRIANRLSDRELYSWHIYSVDGEPVTASNGMSVVAEAPIAAVPFIPTVFVCASFAAERQDDRRLMAWLRRLDRLGGRLGALETGAYILARAGLLNGHRATMHWENAPAFTERFPDIELTSELFEIDGKRMTCSGGTAAIDLMLHLIEQHHGQTLALAISEQLIHERIRAPADHRRMALGRRLGVRQPKLLRIVEAMYDHLEEPLGLEQLAAVGGMSRRQLERLFRTCLNETPSGFYLALRLDRARQLLEQTDMRVVEVSLACGFASAPYFSRAYRARFGCTPREDRRNLRAEPNRTGRFAGGQTRLERH